MKAMNKQELDAEIARVKEAIQKTESPYLIADYNKYLHRLNKMKRFG